jgi:hypothetical protein
LRRRAARHFILLLQTTSPQALEPPSRHELAVVRSTGLVTLVLVVLTLANIVWGEVEVDDTDAMPADVAESTEKGSVTLPDSRPVRPIMAEEVLEQASPVFRRAVLAGCGLTTVLVATVTLSDGRASSIRSTPSFAQSADPCCRSQTAWRRHSSCQSLSRCLSFCFRGAFVWLLSIAVRPPKQTLPTSPPPSSWLSTAGLSLGLLAGTLIWFHLAIAYLEVSSFGPAGHPPWRSLAWLSLLVSLGHSVWLASLYVSIGARAPSDEGPDASIVHRLRLSVRRIHDVTLDRLLRAAPVIQIHDGLTESPPDSPV